MDMSNEKHRRELVKAYFLQLELVIEKMTEIELKNYGVETQRVFDHLSWAVKEF